MFCRAGFDQWRTTIMQHLPHLSKPQARVLALWSFGMVLAHSCALSAVSHFLARGMKRKEQTVRQQLRAWYYEVPRQRGWTVIVLTDRGLYAPWLFRRIVHLDCHPLMCINTGGTLRPAGTPCFRPLKSLVPTPGTRWRGQSTAFQKAGRQVVADPDLPAARGQ